jgi:hypothetical protein
VLKGAVAPTDRTTAAALAVQAVGDFIASLAPLSAGARLLEAAPRVSLDGINSIALPARSGAIDPTKVPWVAHAMHHHIPRVTRLTEECRTVDRTPLANFEE